MIMGLFACKERKTIPAGSVHHNTLLQLDTMITYDLEDISTEGGEAAVSYMDGRIRNAVLRIFGETGQARISYDFSGDSVLVIEKQYRYTTDIMHVRSDKDIKLDKEFIYKMDRNGTTSGDSLNDRMDIYGDFRKVVPLTLNNND